MFDWLQSSYLWALAVAGIWVAGFACTFHALMRVRSERATVAWCIALISMPALAVPFYLIFGRRSFHGYHAALAKALEEHGELIRDAREAMGEHWVAHDDLPTQLHSSLSSLNRWPFSRGNHFELLIDGDRTFTAIEEAISKSESYILFQFYIIRDDGLGRRLKEALIERAKAGVRVHFLYDEIGSHGLPRGFKDDLTAAGVEVDAFGTTRGRSNRFQINFRNHRKIVVVDGKVAFVGGHNVGDEYLGESEKFGHWRDTHLRITGPSVKECQGVFLQDWYWASRKLPEVDTVPEAVADGGLAMVMPSGPTRDFEVCQMAFQILIGGAREKLWIASPYLVPDEATLVALQHAVHRGVDVRVMIPAVKDHLIVYLAAFSFFEEMEKSGIKVLRYGPGFLHQKAILVDDAIAGIGTVNIDERSFRLNFEVTAFSCETEFVASVTEMFETDFESCVPATAADYHDKSLLFRLGVRIARLFSPIL